MPRPRPPRYLACYHKNIDFKSPTLEDAKRLADVISKLFVIEKQSSGFNDLITNTADAIATISAKARDSQLKAKAVVKSLQKIIARTTKLIGDIDAGKAIKKHRLSERVNKIIEEADPLIKLLPGHEYLPYLLEQFKGKLTSDGADTALIEILRIWLPIITEQHSTYVSRLRKNTARDPLRTAIALLAMNFRYFGHNIPDDARDQAWKEYVNTAIEFGNAHGYFGRKKFPERKALVALTRAHPVTASLNLAL